MQARLDTRAKSRLAALLSALALMCAAPLAGCGEDAEPKGETDDNGGGDGDGDGDANGDGDGDGAADGGENSAPLYAITTQVFGADPADNQSYIILTDTLTPESKVTLDTEGEVVLGRALGTGPEGEGVLFVAGDADPTVTKYTLTEEGTLQKGDTASFVEAGLASIGEYGGQFHYVSDNKAYLFDGPTSSVVVWDPKDMRYTSRIELPDLVLDEETLTTFSGAPIAREGQVITFVGWRKGPQVPSVAAVVVVDTASDTAKVVKDERCGYVRDGIEADDGFIYAATEAYGAAVHLLNDANAAAPCLLRFNPETQEFDPDFKVELNSLFGGTPAGSLIRGPDGTGYVKVFDETKFSVQADTHPRVLASATAWKWASVTLGDAPSASELEADVSGGSVVAVELGGVTYAPLFEGRDSTTFLPITADGLGEATLSVPGLAFSLAKLR